MPAGRAVEADHGAHGAGLPRLCVRHLPLPQLHGGLVLGWGAAVGSCVGAWPMCTPLTALPGTCFLAGTECLARLERPVSLPAQLHPPSLRTLAAARRCGASAAAARCPLARCARWSSSGAASPCPSASWALTLATRSPRPRFVDPSKGCQGTVQLTRAACNILNAPANT